MFRKRTKKNYPPGTFIALPTRITAILQLCLVFTILLWHASQPFMGDLFAVKSKMVLYEYVMNQDLFNGLPLSKQEGITDEYSALQHQLKKPFLAKLKSSFVSIVGLPRFELAWLILSIVGSVLLLKRVEGAVGVICLLPLLVAAYAVDNRMYSLPQGLSMEEQLFPSESFLVSQYLEEPLSANIFEQHKQLKKSWGRYLIAEWSSDGQTLVQGEFAFHLARLDALRHDTTGLPQEGLWRLALYLFWNISFAVLAYATANQINPYACKIANQCGEGNAL